MCRGRLSDALNPGRCMKQDVWLLERTAHSAAPRLRDECVPRQHMTHATAHHARAPSRTHACTRTQCDHECTHTSKRTHARSLRVYATDAHAAGMQQCLNHSMANKLDTIDAMHSKVSIALHASVAARDTGERRWRPVLAQPCMVPAMRTCTRGASPLCHWKAERSPVMTLLLSLCDLSLDRQSARCALTRKALACRRASLRGPRGPGQRRPYKLKCWGSSH